jgi:hypothetical protein
MVLPEEMHHYRRISFPHNQNPISNPSSIQPLPVAVIVFLKAPVHWASTDISQLTFRGSSIPSKFSRCINSCVHIIVQAISEEQFVEAQFYKKFYTLICASIRLGYETFIAPCP